MFFLFLNENNLLRFLISMSKRPFVVGQTHKKGLFLERHPKVFVEHPGLTAPTHVVLIGSSHEALRHLYVICG